MTLSPIVFPMHVPPRVAPKAAALALLPAFLLAILGCGQVDPADPGFAEENETTSELGGSSAELRLNFVGHNGGQILPHQALAIFNPTVTVDLRTPSDFRQNVEVGNPVLPTPPLPTTAVLPNGRPGNHFFGIELTNSIDLKSVFALPGSTALTRVLTLSTVDPVTGVERRVPARVLVGGVTAVDSSQGPKLQRWLTFDESTGRAVAVVPEARGFLDISRERQRSLLLPRSILIIADTDGDLTTLETFPNGGALNLRLTTDLTTTKGNALTQPVFISTHVGADTVPPRLATIGASQLAVTPADGATDIDPATEITVRFTESVQPALLGGFVDRDFPQLSSFLGVQFGPVTQRADVPINLEPVSPFDLSLYRFVPGYAFPGTGPDGVVTPFQMIDLGFAMDEVMDLADIPGSGLLASSFTTGPGAALINAPVIPEAILAIRSLPGAGGDGISVVDLNGFGASTGNPVSSPGFPLKGESRYPFNPNVAFQPGLLPPPGITTVDGGSAGVFTLTLDSNLSDALATAPSIQSAQDVHVGHSLDGTLRNAPPPFGCQSGGGNVCALDGIKVIAPRLTASGTLEPIPQSQFGSLNPGYENIVSWAPHPNPPALVFPPLCVSPLLGSREPLAFTSASTNNLLIPGDALGDAASMTPPSGLLSLVQTSYFVGPTQGQVDPLNCDPYMIRQQIGQYVYVGDKAASEIVILNSNSMQVIDRIPVSDVGSMAMGPNLDRLAVTNPAAGTVTFIDTNPSSFLFHRIRRQVTVGDMPMGVAWSPHNEDVLVCNEGSDTVSVISASNYLLRKTVDIPAGQPFDVVMTPRETTFGLRRGVYYGYILSRSGEISVFESGPNGINGWGFDDVIGTLPFLFQSPKTLQLNPTRGYMSVAVVHEGPIDPITGQPGALGDGAISTVEITGGQMGQIPLTSGQAPQFRSITFEVVESLGASTGSLSGVPTDVAFDEMWNLGGLSGPRTDFSAGSPIPANSKANYRDGISTQTNFSARGPRFMLAAVPSAGAIDVLQAQVPGSPPFDVDIYAPGVQPISASGVRSLAGFWRQ